MCDFLMLYGVVGELWNLYIDRIFLLESIHRHRYLYVCVFGVCQWISHLGSMVQLRNQKNRLSRVHFFGRPRKERHFMRDIRWVVAVDIHRCMRSCEGDQISESFLVFGGELQR